MSEAIPKVLFVICDGEKYRGEALPFHGFTTKRAALDELCDDPEPPPKNCIVRYVPEEEE